MKRAADTNRNQEENTQEEEKPRSNRLQKATAILLLALLVFIGLDAYFNNWSIVRTLVSLNTLQLKDKSGKTWDLLARRDFQIVKISNVQRVVRTDSLIDFDKPYQQAGYYRLYFRQSDSSSARLQRMYQALLSIDSAQTIKRTVDDAERAYQNLKHLLHRNQPMSGDSSKRELRDSAAQFSKGDLALGAGNETAVMVRRFVSSPQVLVGAGIGIVASAGVDLLRGDAFVAYSKDDVFRVDSLLIGSQVGRWEGSPIDIVWVFAPSDSVVVRRERDVEKAK